MSRLKQKELGYITVDAGLVFVGDPCYQSDGNSDFEDWSKFVDTYAHQIKNGVMKLKHEKNNEGKGIVINTPFGDGVYPVIGSYNKDGDLKSITIKFF